MSTGWIIVIIVVVLAIILSNIMLLKQTANMKMPSLKELEPSNETDQDGKEQSESLSTESKKSEEKPD